MPIALDAAGTPVKDDGMALSDLPDPAALFREMLSQWEQMANEFGGQIMKSGEFARVMHGANNAAMTAKAASGQVMERALAAANMPSRGDLEELAARIGRIEDTVLRIESLLIARGPSPAPERPAAKPPRPRRTRQPAGKSPG